MEIFEQSHGLLSDNALASYHTILCFRGKYIFRRTPPNNQQVHTMWKRLVIILAWRKGLVSDFSALRNPLHDQPSILNPFKFFNFFQLEQLRPQTKPKNACK